MKISVNDMAKLEKVFDPVLEWLDVDVYEKFPKLGFNMNMYINDVRAVDFSGKDCDQTFCIIGYLKVYHGFFTCHNHLKEIVVALNDIFEFEDIEKVSRCLEQLATVDDKTQLRTSVEIEKIKPYQAAATIRYFLKTGKVKWKKFLPPAKD